MKSKSLLYIGITVLVLIAAWGLPRLLKTLSSEHITDLDLRSLSSDTVDRISIKQGDNQVELTRTSNGWQVGEFEADAQKINGLWEKLSQTSIIGPVSRNKANHSKFEVDEAKGVRVGFQQGDEEHSVIIIGKRSVSFNTSYVRLAKSSEVYVIDINLRSLFPLAVNDWRNKTVVQISREQVKRIKFIYPEGNFQLSLIDNGEWQAEDDSGLATTTSESVINSLFNSLNPLTADTFIEDKEKIENFNTATSTKIVRFLTDAQGTLAAELRLVEENDNWWAQVTDNDTIYEIPKFRLSSVLLDQKVLFGADYKL